MIARIGIFILATYFMWITITKESITNYYEKLVVIFLYFIITLLASGREGNK